MLVSHTIACICELSYNSWEVREAQSPTPSLSPPACLLNIAPHSLALVRSTIQTLAVLGNLALRAKLSVAGAIVCTGLQQTKRAQSSLLRYPRTATNTAG